MILSNDQYHIRIQKDSKEPWQGIDVHAYDYVFDPFEYMDNEFHSAFTITIQSGRGEMRVVFIGSFYAQSDQCAVLEGESLSVLMDNEIVRFDIPAMKIVVQKRLDTFSCFSIYPVQKDYIIHSELEILRLDNAFDLVWSFGGSDIFVTHTGADAAFKMADDQILLEDWNGIRYALDMNGKLLWTTYNP